MHPHGHDHHADTPADPPMRHGMVVLGADTVYLSHLPMFTMAAHAYQVLLEVELTGPDGRPDRGYADDRRDHPAVLHTLNPERFRLPDLLPGDGPPARSSFRATVFRHHFERGAHSTPPVPDPVPVAQDITVTVRRVVHGRRFAEDAARPDRLSYVLFGRGDEHFLAHLITRPPDFDQLLRVRLDPQPADDDLARGLRVTVPERADRAAERIRPGDGVVGGILHAADGDTKIGIEPVTEFYLEENELAE